MARRRKKKSSTKPDTDRYLALAVVGAAFLAFSTQQFIFAIAAILVVGVGIVIFFRRSRETTKIQIAPAPSGAFHTLPDHTDVDLYPIWKETNQSEAQQSIDTTKWSLDLIRRLEWRRFEEVCEAYFQVLGFKTRINQFGPDGGIDITLYEQDQTTPSIVVQCKAWNAKPVGVKELRELIGVMTTEKVDEGIFVTSSSFTPEARDTAGKVNIHLFDGNGLLAHIVDLPSEKVSFLLALATKGDFFTPTCPSCAVKMTSRTNSKDGQKFWGCVHFPRCRKTFFGAINRPD